MSKLNVSRAARILVDAEAMGDVRASEKWKVDERTIRNYRSRLQTDPDLSAAFTEKTREAERAWHLVRNRFLRDVTEHLRELCLKAEPGQISDVRAAIKDIGELDLAREALGVGPSDHHSGQQTPGDGGKTPPEDDSEAGSD
jgi:hypothetical protein